MMTIATCLMGAYLSILATGGSGPGPLQPGEPARELSRRTYEVVATGDHAFAATSAGLTVHDLSRMDRPEEIATVFFPGSGNAVSLAGRHALLSLGPDCLRVLDVSNPSRPVYIGTLDTGGSVNAAVAVKAGGNEYIVIADGPSGVRSIRAMEGGGLSTVSSIDPNHYAWALSVSGDLIAVAYGDDGAGLLRIDGTGKFNEVADLPLEGAARGIVLKPPLCFVAAGLAGLVVFDVSVPGRPKAAGSFRTEDYARGIAVDGETIYLADGRAGLKILAMDASGGTVSLRQRASHETSGIANRVSIRGTTALVAVDGSGIDLVDVSDPDSPGAY